MLKHNIKIIVVGLFLVFGMVLAYSFFGAKQEIISDESLRVEEPELPGFKVQSQKTANAQVVNPINMSEQQIESSLESKLIDQPVARFREGLMADTAKETVSGFDGQAVAQVVELEPMSVIGEESLKVPVEPIAKVLDEPVIPQVSEIVGAQSVSPFRDDAIKRFDVDSKSISKSAEFLSFEVANKPEEVVYEASESMLVEQESDVELIPDRSEFLNLNLAEVKHEQEMVLVEGDQLIVDDINQSITANDLIGAEVEQVEVAPAVISINKTSVFSLPEVDQSLMQGDSEVSQQYRQTMTKLVSINARLREADEENANLKAQFEMSVDNNRQLAQIIRDIDDQIKSFTLTN